jgi:uncharacterized protein
MATSGASFDCIKADREVEKMICDDPPLASLDRQLGEEYRHTLAAPGADRSALEGTQRGWVSGRNECWQADEARRCVVEAYRTRLVELKIDDPDTVTPPTVTYECPGGTSFTARFYNQFDPPAAIVTRGADTAVVFARQSGSGAHYGREGVDYWEHQGQITVDFYGDRFVCSTP